MFSVFMITLSTIYLFHERIGNQTKIKKISSSNSSVVTYSDPLISINGNEELTVFCEEGNGTKDSPYIIQNFGIKFSKYDNETGIIIRDTNKPLIIQNCTLDSDSTTWEEEFKNTGMGIYLYNCSNIHIFNLQITNTSTALCAKKVTNLSIANLIITHSQFNAITLEGNTSSISHCNLENNLNQIYAEGEQINITSNVMKGPGMFAIDLSGNCHLVYNNTSEGFSGRFNTGLRIHGSNHQIIQNGFYNCSASAIYSWAHNCSFIGNNCSFNRYGLNSFADNCLIDQNIILNNKPLSVRWNYENSFNMVQPRYAEHIRSGL